MMMRSKEEKRFKQCFYLEFFFEMCDGDLGQQGTLSIGHRRDEHELI